ncbi:MAG TPA: cytidylate kinase-like family protein [Gemmatimonadales bacterium]|jgi:cytidylate kinase
MPFVTVSRMYGSGGSEVAERVATQLGWALFDNAMIDAVAQQSGLTRDEVSEQDERVPGMVERLASALSLSSPELMHPTPARGIETTEERIVAITRKVIEQAVAAGPAVFVGRGAQCLLAERGDALHVFCYASRAALVENAITRLGVPAADAERVVADTNRQREHYVKRHWKRNWLAFENYHLCLNTGSLGIEGAAKLVVEAARRRFG